MKPKHIEYKGSSFDMRSPEEKIGEFLSLPEVACGIFGGILIVMFMTTGVHYISNFIFIFAYLYYLWYRSRDIGLELKYPMQVKGLKHHKECKKADGIMFVGNQKKKDGEDGREVWISNSDARTHILFLGTTGSGKTEGLKLISTNALSWGSGFVFVDGKGDTNVWADFYALARRFGRDDDLLLLNYMTGNADGGGKSNSMNPFANGSASYLTNLLVGLMDEAGGDNAMWKGRAISLMTAIMPALTWQRDNKGLLLDVDAIRNTLTLDKIVALSRNKELPKKVQKGVYGYLDTLPGYVDSAFGDDGKEKPQGPDDPPHDLSTCYQQHGFLSMQFTRSLGSLADEYGYIFKQNLADIDINDVVLNNRMMFVTIPILEKSGDEAANLGKIVASSIKGMMGAALGADIEGSWQDIIENKITARNSPFVTIFDEVGYYTSQGMAAMAAQARSLGFSLVFAGQDLAAMEKRVKEEAKSITANCNLKIFGKLEDPGPTKEFFEKNVGKMDILTQGNFELKSGLFSNKTVKKENLSVASVNVVKYDDLRKQGQGHVHMIWAANVLEVQMAYIQPYKVKAIRMNSFLKVIPGVSSEFKDNFEFSNFLMDKYRQADWTAEKDAIASSVESNELIDMLRDNYRKSISEGMSDVEASTSAVASTFEGVDFSAQDENLDDFSKFFGESDDDTDDSVPFGSSSEGGLLDDMGMDDFQKMLDSYKSDDFDDAPPFSEFVNQAKDPAKDEAEVEKMYKPTINLTNTLPWEESGKGISDDVISKALNEIWGREIIEAPLVMPDEKKEMSSDFVQAMKRYMSPDKMDRQDVVNAVLRATADIISGNMGGDIESIEAINSVIEDNEARAEEIQDDDESIEVDVPLGPSDDIPLGPLAAHIEEDSITETTEEVTEEVSEENFEENTTEQTVESKPVHSIESDMVEYTDEEDEEAETETDYEPVEEAAKVDEESNVVEDIEESAPEETEEESIEEGEDSDKVEEETSLGEDSTEELEEELEETVEEVLDEEAEDTEEQQEESEESDDIAIKEIGGEDGDEDDDFSEFFS